MESWNEHKESEEVYENSEINCEFKDCIEKGIVMKLINKKRLVDCFVKLAKREKEGKKGSSTFFIKTNYDILQLWQEFHDNPSVM